MARVFDIWGNRMVFVIKQINYLSAGLGEKSHLAAQTEKIFVRIFEKVILVIREDDVIYGDALLLFLAGHVL